jgi:hypothetical protein
MAEGETTFMNPSPIWVMISGAEKRILYVLCVATAKENLSLLTVPFHNQSNIPPLFSLLLRLSLGNCIKCLQFRELAVSSVHLIIGNIHVVQFVA